MSDIGVYPVRNHSDYEAALAEIERLMSAAPGTREGDRLDVLTTLVQAYEMQHYPIEAPDPVSLIEHLMEARGLTQRDLEPALGTAAQVSEVLNRRRPLSLEMIRALHRQFGLPAEALIEEYPVARGAG